MFIDLEKQYGKCVSLNVDNCLLLDVRKDQRENSLVKGVMETAYVCEITMKDNIALAMVFKTEQEARECKKQIENLKGGAKCLSI